jgi:uncharacterized protein RhaS with RHS repeats
VYGEGNVYDYGFRIYNPRLGKFLSVDPLTSTFPFLTPYQYASNKPIVAIDLDGLECLWVHIYKDKDGTVLRTTTTQDVSEEQRAEASNTLGFELPTNGVVVTSEQEGQKKLDYYVPEVEIHAKRTEPSKTDKIIEAIKNFDQKLQGSSDVANSGYTSNAEIEAMDETANYLTAAGLATDNVILIGAGKAVGFASKAAKVGNDYKYGNSNRGATIIGLEVASTVIGSLLKIPNKAQKQGADALKDLIFDKVSNDIPADNTNPVTPSTQKTVVQ